jgi:hypothetical protein
VFDYNLVQSVTLEDFQRHRPADSDLRDPSKFTSADSDEVAKIERLLDVQAGTLGDGYYMEYRLCPTCNRLLTMYDLVFTAMVDAGHPKSLILHTFVGTKLILNVKRPIRCSQCAQVANPTQYACNGYSCLSST